jgi:flagellar basal body-associated protein FliL
MKNLSDEILNKFTDNELDQATLKMVREQLKISEEDRKRLKAIQAVDNGLRDMKSESVSTDFTSVLMKRISKKSKAKKEQQTFIISISSIFVIIALAIVGYVMHLIFSAPPSTTGGTAMATRETLNIMKDVMEPVKSFFANVNISVIGSVFSLGLLISIYFVFDLVKHTKNNLSRQH